MERDVHWNVPLNARLQSGITRMFSSVYEALDFLENEWPVKTGNRYKNAVASCRGALNRTTPVAVARDAFVAACYEAGVGVTSAMPTQAWPTDHRTGLR
jgi:hypothetical protein